MRKKVYVRTFLTSLVLLGLIFSCENSNSEKVNSEAFALVQPPGPDLYPNRRGTGNNFVVNGNHDTSSIQPFIVRVIIAEHNSACTGTMIAEHWLLTAAHCVVGLSSSNVEVIYTAPGGSNVTVHDARGDFYIHPEFTRPPKKDLALIHLRGAIFSVPVFPRKAEFYTDPRVPWQDRSQSSIFFFGGYGLGSEAGSNIPCTPGTDGIKRIAQGSLIASTFKEGMIRGKGLEGAKACQGDSGMPFLFPRFINNIFVPLLFGVLTATVASDQSMQGNLLQKQELNWIFNTIRLNSPFHIDKVEWTNEWKRTSISETAYLFTEIKEGNGKCLDVDGARTEPGTPVQIYTCNGTVGQQWTISPSGGIYYRNNLCLDMGLGQTGVQFTVQICNSSNTQKFAIQKTGGITGPFDSFAQRCLSVRNGSSEDRSPVEFLPCFGGPFQTWSWGN
ncbi:ricin-type beta-trefoil lectin domain protein [Leptospira perolatii]|nr:ricin-type beta-trefoil lectin domain protein [Leptospira perolatii]